MRGGISRQNLLLLLLVIILGLGIFAVTSVSVVSPNKNARRDATRTSIANFHAAIDCFDATKNRLPESLAELTGLLDKRDLNDSWGHPIQYKKIDQHKYEVSSAGPDGELGTEDDLTN